MSSLRKLSLRRCTDFAPCNRSRPIPDALTNLSQSVPFFPPVIVKTSPVTGSAQINHVMPLFQLQQNATVYVYSARFTPSLQFDGFGNDSLTNLIRRSGFTSRVGRGSSRKLT